MRFLLIILALFTLPSIYAQSINLVQVCALPDTLNESSGIAINNDSTVWTHNDSGDTSRIFLINKNNCSIIRTVYFNGINAYDFEEITKDDNGNLFVGDFGNNSHQRTDLKIYIIDSLSLATNNLVNVDTIQFSFSDQTIFPAPPHNKNFDCEAMVHLNGFIYLFSKNHSASGFTKVYQLPAMAGSQSAILLDSVYTTNWITSAALNKSKTVLALLSETRILLFRNFPGNDFFSGSQITIEPLSLTQKEAICFANDSVVYLTDEEIFNTGGNLYTTDLSYWINDLSEYKPSSTGIEIKPIGNNCYEVNLNHHYEKSELGIYNLTGQLVMFNQNPASIQIIDLNDMPQGIYILQLKLGLFLQSFKIYKC